ncbi:Myb-related transcription factor, partner of profilin-like [Oopsacas minuta]|uniref:Myb-related transcription factor, partner of profilin-like n=1 Tax=Oopsacas minuta TaxID=111878 RepID=A0AAV7JIP1_9METZ|nr:Myb-related transcription factor, partner of profilin-like [Oopsacas minuta]
MKTENSFTEFTQDEIMSLVDLIHDQKWKLFGALTSTMTFDDKNKIWEEISERLSELHGNVRTRDDVMKKWYNVLTKHKPCIADKLASARKTGGGPADADLDEIEAKISSIKGKEAFEGIESGIDLPLESQSSNDETKRMLMSSVPTEDIEKINFFQPAPRKRHRLETDELESTKRAILEKEDKKLEILANIDSKLDRLESKFDRVIQILQHTAADQSKTLSLLMLQTMPPLPHFQTLPLHFLLLICLHYLITFKVKVRNP